MTEHRQRQWVGEFLAFSLFIGSQKGGKHGHLKRFFLSDGCVVIGVICNQQKKHIVTTRRQCHIPRAGPACGLPDNRS